MNYLNKDGLSYLWGKITTLLNKKQDTLTAGTGITITNNVISSFSSEGPQGEPGPAGKDGFSPTIEVTDTETGVLLTITDSTGTKTATVNDGVAGPQGPAGKDGVNGQDGHTPVRGTDYWTADDKTEIVNSVLAALPAAEGVSV